MKFTVPTRLLQARKKLRARAHGLHLELLQQFVRTHSSLGCFGSLGPLVSSLKEAQYGDLETITALLEAADSLSIAVHTDALKHFIANQLVALIKKYPFPVPGLDGQAEKRAWDKFQAAEQKCAAMNLMYTSSDSSHEGLASDEVLERMRSFITYVIGNSPRLDVITDQCDFGPGANIGIHGNATSRKRKLLSAWSVSPGAIDYARYSLHKHIQIHELLVDPDTYVRDEDAFHKAFNQRLDIVLHNDITFVPKTTLTRRSIAIEPCLNSYLQKGIDLEMRKLLKKNAHIDLSDQKRNSDMAREGSVSTDDPFSTIDLSSASDSISIAIVKRLLPPDWFYLLNRIRSESFRYKGKVYPYQKFCSMGNGFCFPLQTLIFLAACHAVGGGVSNVDFRVYGDDIIIRGSKADSLIALLRSIGFDTNPAKTFTSGPFRESCGEDYWQGVDVRPVYLDYKLDDVRQLIKFHNSTLRGALTSTTFENFRSVLRLRVPVDLRFVAPHFATVTDECFRVEESHPDFLTSRHTRWVNNLWCWSWKEFQSVPIEDRSNYGHDRRTVGITYLYAALSGGDSGKTFTIRRKTRTNVRRMSYGGATSQWLPSYD